MRRKLIISWTILVRERNEIAISQRCARHFAMFLSSCISIVNSINRDYRGINIRQAFISKVEALISLKASA